MCRIVLMKEKYMVWRISLLFLFVLCMTFNEDGSHADPNFTKNCVMLSSSSVTRHLGYRSDTEDLLQEALLACNLLNLSSESSQKSG